MGRGEAGRAWSSASRPASEIGHQVALRPLVEEPTDDFNIICQGLNWKGRAPRSDSPPDSRFDRGSWASILVVARVPFSVHPARRLRPEGARDWFP